MPEEANGKRKVEACIEVGSEMVAAAAQKRQATTASIDTTININSNNSSSSSNIVKNMTPQRWNLVGRNVVVTGGTKGIGHAVTAELLSLGARVLTCSRKADELTMRQQEWTEQGFQVYTCMADVGTVSGREALLNATKHHFGDRVDCLVNNVGTNIRKKFADYTQDEITHVMSTNLTSSVELCKAFYPLLQQSELGASVVNVGSVAGGCGASMKSGAPYAMTKAALTQLSYNLSVEWAKDNIRVNVVSPWYISTPLTEAVLSDPHQLQQILNRTPMGRTGKGDVVPYM